MAFEQLIGLAGASFPCRRAEGHEGCAAAAAVLDRLEVARDHLAAATGIRQRTGSQRLQRPIVERCLAYLEAERAGRRTAHEFL